MNATASGPGAVDSLDELCAAAARSLPASGVAVSVMTDGGATAMAGGSDDATRSIEELQVLLGEGPCLEAFHDQRPVLVRDLAEAAQRWPAYSAAAQELGVRAVFAFPLQIGAARLGVMDVYRSLVGSLSRTELTHALSLAREATFSLLDAQEHAGDGLLPTGVDDALQHTLEVHQAQGMVMVQLGVSLASAMARLRAYAYANERSLADVAHDIVARTLTLDKDEP